jgi:hypothetical protein
MKRIFMLGFLFGSFYAWGQKTPQLDALLAAQNDPAPALLEFTPQYEEQEYGRRERLKALKGQLDTLDIPESRRLRIMRDLYRGRELHWLEKYHLEAGHGRDSLQGKDL